MAEIEFPIEVNFANGKFTLLSNKTCKSYILTVDVEAYDENWKDAINKNKPVILAGTVFSKWSVYKTLYGVFVEVYYLNFHYRLKPSLCSISKPVS